MGPIPQKRSKRKSIKRKTNELKKNNNKQMPTVALLVSKSITRKLIRGKRFNYYKRLVELCKASQTVKVPFYIFDPEHVYFKTKTIKGIYLKKGVWIQDYFPFPNVLYDSFGSNSQIASRVRAVFEKNKIKKLNSTPHFNKWDVYEKLAKNENVRDFLPETKKYTSHQDLEQFIDLHKTVYLKGVRGSRGRRIFFINKSDDGTYKYGHFRGHLRHGKTNSFSDLVKKINKFYNDRTFIMQQAIDLFKIDHSNIDFRAEVQRNGKGEVVIAGVAARVGVPNSPITIHSKAYTIDEFIEKYTNYSNEEIIELKAKVSKFLYDIYHAIEEEYGPYGEIGIDFGIDKSGEIVFIEPNVKSAKVSLMKAYSRSHYKDAFINPLEYARHITFTNNQPNEISK